MMFDPIARLVLLAGVAVLVGCGSRGETAPKPAAPVAEQSATEQPSTKPSTELPERAETPAKPDVETRPVKEPQPMLKPTVDDGLRSLVQKLARKDGSKWTIDEQAQQELEKQGPGAVDKLLPLMADESADVRRGAAYHLLPLAASRDDLAQVFVGLLDDGDTTIRGIALSAVGRLKSSQKAEAASALAKMLARIDADDQQRSTAARLLGDLGQQAASLLSQLEKTAAADVSPKVRSSALLAISRISDPAQTVATMTKAVEDKDSSVRLMAVQRLRELGRDAEPALQPLAKLLEEKDERIRKTAGEALVRIGSRSVPALTAALESSSRDTREVALTALGKMGPLAKPALTAIRKRLSDSDPKVKELAKRTVLEIEAQ